MKKVRSVYKTVVRKLEAERPLGKPKHRWDYIK
jgi:hypothetical protein